MTYNVFGGTLSLAQSINQSTYCHCYCYRPTTTTTTKPIITVTATIVYKA